MKTVLLFLLVISSVVNAQDTIPMRNGEILYELVDSGTVLSKTDLYNNAKLWMANTFITDPPRLSVDDKEAGEILGKSSYFFEYQQKGFKRKGKCNFTLRISLKDQRYRVQVSNLYATSGNDPNPYDMNQLNSLLARKPKDKMLRSMADNFNKTFNGLLASAKTNISSPKKDDF